MLSRPLARRVPRCLVNEFRKASVLGSAGTASASASASAVRPRRYKSTEAQAQVSPLTSSYLSSSASASTSIPNPNLNPNPRNATTESESEDETGTGTVTLPFLPRPLGVLEPPSTARKSWRDETLELIDQDVRLSRRKHILKEASKGYFHDLNATRKHGGKTWIAPRTLIREDAALYFPDISGNCLASRETVHTTDLCRGKISVVAMLSTAISEEHVDSFVRHTNESFLSNPHYRFIQVNLQENIAKAFLVSLYVSSLRRNVPKELHPTYVLSKQNMEYLREPLGMNNKHIGFVYLLDANLRVRWAGGGLALPSEAESLTRCAKVLLERMEKKAVDE